MYLDVLKAVEGERYGFSFEAEPFADIYEGRDVIPVSTLKVEGGYYVDKGRVFVDFHEEVEVVAKCDRCLSEIKTVHTADDKIVFSKKPDDGEFLYENFTVPLDAALREALSLTLPSYYLCKVDCKGLCPVCGADKNKIQCSCEDSRRAAVNPFAVLQTIGGKEDGSTKK